MAGTDLFREKFNIDLCEGISVICLLLLCPLRSGVVRCSARLHSRFWIRSVRIRTHCGVRSGVDNAAASGKTMVPLDFCAQCMSLAVSNDAALIIVVYLYFLFVHHKSIILRLHKNVQGDWSSCAAGSFLGGDNANAPGCPTRGHQRFMPCLARIHGKGKGWEP